MDVLQRFELYSSKRKKDIFMTPFRFDLGCALEDLDASAWPEEYDFEGCCGASVISGFPAITIHELRKAWIEQIDDWVHDNTEYDICDKCIKPERPKNPSDKYFKDLLIADVRKSFNTTYSNGHLYLIVLNEHQLIFEPLLKEKGFRKVSDRVVNEGTGNRLYLYTRDPLTPKGKSLKKSRF